MTAAKAPKQPTMAEQLAAMRAGLPHLYERKWYQWAKTLFDSRNSMTLLCAANQISKSSTQIRKCIEWAGNQKLWAQLWKPEHSPPRQFWYLYPDRGIATSEYHLKWVPEFLPRGAYKSAGPYGWKPAYGDKRQISSIQFNSGVIVNFKTYEQDPQNLQSGTCHAIFCDEELPEHLYSELQFRLSAVDGYFSMVFTATRNQAFWKRVLEGDGDAELFPEALKIQVSMYDCQTYTDGTPGAYSEEKIAKIKARCKSETEIQRRVYGRFVTEVGRKYGAFDAGRHFVKPYQLPIDWQRYAAVDSGSGGGGQRHPPAIVFVAVRPDHRLGAVYKAWRGDDGQIYTNGDIFEKFLQMRAQHSFVLQKYDYAAKDFQTISDRAGETFLPSDKSHERGEDVINTLFKNDMLVLFDDDETRKLGSELSSLMHSTAKKHAKDDLCDALRYCVVDIPWDWSALKDEPTEDEKLEVAARPYTDQERLAMEIAARRGEMFDDGRKKETDDWGELDDEFRYWNERAGG